MKDDKAPERPARTVDYLAAEAGRSAEDARELERIAVTVRPVVDAGNGRALGFEVVRQKLLIFSAHRSDALFAWLWPLAVWLFRATQIDRGERVLLGETPATMNDVRHFAETTASRVWHRSSTRPIPIETWIVHDIAEALRRACGCSDAATRAIRTLEAHGPEQGRRLAAAARSDQDFTARTLLPLILRDARRLCAAAKVDASAIEAAVARHGGTPS